ncbi:MAG: hypothetical protein C0591_12460 [Marinilabiliales bacterium]|jgi:hypothetical protein|nr:MAG: hypothetical protein C0591_12460 [Marinilabiliales bacterium]
MFRKILVFTLIMMLTKNMLAQEFLCNVQIQTPRIEGIDKSVFDAMKTSIFEFINTRKWSNYNMKIEERITCTMIITINEVISTDDFGGKINLVLERPIYSTDYNSVVINIVDDDIRFRYVPNQPMEFIDGSYSNNLTSILGFYAYLMLGLDFDTFSLEGGTTFYEKALATATAAQSGNELGWRAFEGPKNRYQLIEGLLNSSYKQIRTFLYEYHRRGLDVMSKDKTAGREVISQSLENLKIVYDKRPGLYVLQVMTEAKRAEIINIFKEASPAEKTNMITIMKEIDPANGSRYLEVNN